MGFQSIEEAEAFIEEHGEDGARERVAQGVFGGDKRTHELVREAFSRRERVRAEGLQLAALDGARRSADASERAANAASRSARWTMVAALVSLVGVLATTVHGWLVPDKSAGEQLALCRNQSVHDLGPTGTDATLRGSYLADCMSGNGFVFQGDQGQVCHASLTAVTEVKQLLPSCYMRPSLLARLKGLLSQ